MGLFGKERHGKLETIKPGRRFVWRLENLAKSVGRVYDSEIAKSYQGVEFHFHMLVGQNGEIGFYMHYKKIPIPKYSFHIRCNGQTMRQHTAHTIPPSTERCGHWNVCNLRDFNAVQSPNGETVVHEFDMTFDEDSLAKHASSEEEGAQEILWTIPSPLTQNLSPFTSRSFPFNGAYYVIRIDQPTPDAPMCAIIYSRLGIVPLHSILLAGQNGDALAALPKSTSMTPQVLNFSREQLQPHQHVSIRVTMYRGGNPLDVLDNPYDANKADQGPATAPSDEQTKKYGVVMEDI